jgi:hypothetical protein
VPVYLVFPRTKSEGRKNYKKTCGWFEQLFMENKVFIRVQRNVEFASILYKYIGSLMYRRVLENVYLQIKIMSGKYN